MAHPHIQGKVVKTFEAGEYTVKDPICIVEDLNGK